jgi:hypothetical protein
MPMSIRKPMSADTPRGPAGEERRRGRADGREWQAEQDDERGDERVERQHHRHVDDEDRDAHRDEQAAEGLALLLADPGEPQVHRGGDRAVAEEVREAVDAVVRGAAFRDAAMGMHRESASLPRSAHAVTLLERLVSERRLPTPPSGQANRP